MALYIIDTSVWIAFYKEEYAKDIFPSLWKKIDLLIQKKEILSPPEISEELKKNFSTKEDRDDDFISWYKEREPQIEQFSSKPNQEKEDIVKQLVNDHRKLSGRGVSNPDCSIIAWAKLSEEAFVLSMESENSQSKIPAICRKEKVKHLSPLQFMRKLGWRF